MASEKPKEQLAAKCRIPTVIARVSVELIHQAARKPTKAAPAEARKKLRSHLQLIGIAEPEPHAAGKANHTPALVENILRVDAERIDNVLNLVGELIIGRSMLQQAFTEFARHVPKETLRGRFSDAMSFQSRVLSDLQRSVMKIRMVPVEQLFRRFPRWCATSPTNAARTWNSIISGRHRSGQESPGPHRRTTDTPGSQCGQSRHRKLRGAKRAGKARAAPFVSPPTTRAIR